MRQGDPRWTARVEEDEGAQDPLGMNRVTDRLLRDLLPGITTIAPRPRYIAHHLWALDNVAEREEPGSRAQLMRGLYQRERLLLLSGVRHAQSDTNASHTNLVGARTANKLVRTEDDSINLDFSFSSNRSGSYGRNYVGPLQTMGLVDTPDGAEFEEPTERGEAIAEGYGKIAEETNLAGLATADSVTLDQLDTVAPQLCPCTVSVSGAPDREPLRSLYLGRDPPEEYATQARTRRDTLGLILHVARLGGDTVPLESETLLNACYFGTVQGDNTVLDGDVPAGFDETAARWKAFRAHDYFAYTVEALLASWLAYLKRTEEADATLAEFKQQARSTAVCDRITDQIDLGTLTPETPLSTMLAAMWPDASEGALRDETTVTPVPMTHAASEHTLDTALQTALSDSDWMGVYAMWPCLLLAVSLRMASPSGTDAAAWEWLRSRTESDLSPVRLREHLLMHVEAERSFEAFIDWFIDEYIITRGTEIAAGKGGGVTASRGYFEETATGWRHVRDHTPRHWSARFDSAVTVLRDLALLDPDTSTTTLTPDGIELLETEQEGQANGN